MDENNNGHKDVATLVEDETLKELVSKWGEMTTEVGADAVSAQQKLGVLQRVITTVLDDREYRQALYQGYFDTKDESRLAADAITERRRYGVEITPILDRVASGCAVKGRRVGEAIGGVNSHNIFTNRGNNGGAPVWKRKQEDRTLA